MGELKLLTVDRLEEILKTTVLYYVDDGYLHCKKSAESLLPAINAAMPPDQSARIAELEQQRDELLAALKDVGVQKDKCQWCTGTGSPDYEPCCSCLIIAREWTNDPDYINYWEPTEVAKTVLEAIAKIKEES